MNITFANEQRVLLALLAQELFRCAFPEDVSVADWSSILDEGDRHAVTSLLFPGMMRIPDVPDESTGRVCGAAVSATQMSEHLLRVQTKIIGMLEKHQIPCAILKGTSVAYLYPHPELRTPGDIDILVPSENFKAACDLIINDGFAFSHATDKHSCFQKNDICVELHHMVSEFPDNEKGGFASNYMRDAVHHTHTAQIGDVTFPILTGPYQLISLLAHMERHLFGKGIGLRQFCDWAVTVKAQREQFDASFLALLDQCGLLTFAKIATQLCVKYLGLPCVEWCSNASNDDVNALLLDVLENGNFHVQKEEHFLVSVITDGYNVENSKGESVISSYSKYIRGRIRDEHPRSKSNLWIVAFGIFYPLRWTVRMLLGKRRKFSIRQTIHSAQKREQLLRKLKLYK